MPFKPPEQSLCPLCGKAVYAAEERLAGGKKWHKFCFKCGVCSKMLDSTTCAEHDGAVYCKGCHGKKFGPKGYGFGQGAGALSMETGEQFGNSQSGMTNRPGAGQGGGAMGGPNACGRCGRTVYEMEKANGMSDPWHKSCCSCKICNKKLDPSALNRHEKEIYCKGCYAKKFGTSGYGFGIGAGCLSTDGAIDGESGENGQPGITGRAYYGGPTGGPNACGRCGRTVYEMERVNGMSEPWHKLCCSCNGCGKKLDASALYKHQKEIYCKGCYAKNFGTSGYGFGIGAGCLSTGT